MYFCNLFDLCSCRTLTALISRGGNADFLLEQAAEVRLAGKTYIQGYLGDRKFPARQQMLRLLDAVAAQVCHGSNAYFFRKTARKILLVDAQVGGNIMPGDGFLVMLMDVCHRLVHQPLGFGTQPAAARKGLLDPFQDLLAAE